jgi:hypothetical protein
MTEYRLQKIYFNRLESVSYKIEKRSKIWFMWGAWERVGNLIHDARKAQIEFDRIRIYGETAINCTTISTFKTKG